MLGWLRWPSLSGGVEENQAGLVGSRVFGEVGKNGGVRGGGVVDDEQAPRGHGDLAVGDVGVGFGDGGGGVGEFVGDGGSCLLPCGTAPQEFSVGGGRCVAQGVQGCGAFGGRWGVNDRHCEGQRGGAG